MKKILFTCLLILPFILTACGSSTASGPAGAVEAYFTALVDKDSTNLVNLSCAAWEAGAQTDSRAYDGVTAVLDGLSCTAAGTEDEYTLVACQGNIIATYFGEDKPIPLDARQYLAIEESGQWRMCGYH